MKTIYLMRHSKTIWVNGEKNLKDDFDAENKKVVLSVEGEELASLTSRKDEYKNIDCVYSSDFSRATATAKYFAKDGMNFNVDYRLGEREFGDIQKDDHFILKQYQDENFKGIGGESRKEVYTRMASLLESLLDYDYNNILVVTHSSSIGYYLSKYLEMDIQEGGQNKYHNFKKINYKLNGKTVIEDYELKQCDAIKLVFNDIKEVIDVEYIEA